MNITYIVCIFCYSGLWVGKAEAHRLQQNGFHRWHYSLLLVSHTNLAFQVQKKGEMLLIAETDVNAGWQMNWQKFVEIK
jgi:hypothetical protein